MDGWRIHDYARWRTGLVGVQGWLRGGPTALTRRLAATSPARSAGEVVGGSECQNEVGCKGHLGLAIEIRSERMGAAKGVVNPQFRPDQQAGDRLRQVGLERHP